MAREYYIANIALLGVIFLLPNIFATKSCNNNNNNKMHRLSTALAYEKCRKKTFAMKSLTHHVSGRRFSIRHRPMNASFRPINDHAIFLSFITMPCTIYNSTISKAFCARHRHRHRRWLFFHFSLDSFVNWHQNVHVHFPLLYTHRF